MHEFDLNKSTTLKFEFSNDFFGRIPKKIIFSAEVIQSIEIYFIFIHYAIIPLDIDDVLTLFFIFYLKSENCSLNDLSVV